MTKIIVERGPRFNFIAYIEGDKENTGMGDSVQEAIGFLIYLHRKKFNLKIDESLIKSIETRE